MVPPTSAAGAKSGLVFSGTAMEVPSAGGSPTYVDGLTLRLTATGIAVEGPGDAPGRTVPWHVVEGGRCGEAGLLRDGSPAVTLSATVAGKFVRWLVPSDQLPPARATAVDTLLLARTAAVPSTPPYWSPEPLHGNGQGGASGEGRDVGDGHGDGAVTASGGGVAAPAGDGRPAPGAPAEDRTAAADVVVGDDTSLLSLVTPVFRSQAVPAGPGPAAGRDSTASLGPPRSRAGGRGADDNPWRRPSRRTLVAALWTLVVLLVTLAVLLGVAGARGGGSSAAASHAARSADRLLAVELNVGKADFPAGWSVDTSATGPLTGFLTAGVGSGGGVLGNDGGATPAQRRQQAQVASQFSSCLGVRRADDRILGTGGVRPAARGSSPAFAGPASGQPMQAGSVTVVDRTAADVSAAMTQVLKKRFSTCLAHAVARQVQAAAAATAPGTAPVTGQSTTTTGAGAAAAAAAATVYGSPSVHPLSLFQAPGIQAAGVDLDFPVTVNGATTAVQLGFVFVGGGRVQTTIITFGGASGFPVTLVDRLVQSVEHRMSATGGVTGA